MARIAICRDQMLDVTRDIESILDKIAADPRIPDDLRTKAAHAAGLAQFLNLNARRMEDEV